MHAAIYNHFNAQRHLISARSYRGPLRSLAFLKRHDACGMSPGAAGSEERIVFHLAT